MNARHHLPSRREALIGSGALFAWTQMPRLALCDWSSDVCSSDLGIGLCNSGCPHHADDPLARALEFCRRLAPGFGSGRSEERRVGKEC